MPRISGNWSSYADPIKLTTFPLQTKSATRTSGPPLTEPVLEVRIVKRADESKKPPTKHQLLGYPKEIQNQIFYNLDSETRKQLCLTSTYVFNQVHSETGYIRCSFESQHPQRMSIYKYAYNTTKRCVERLDSPERGAYHIVVFRGGQSYDHDVDLNRFQQGLRVLFQDCQPQAISSLDLSDLTYLTVSMLDSLKFFPQLQRVSLIRCTQLTLDVFFEATTQELIRSFPFSITYDFPEPTAGFYAAFAKVSGLAAFAYTWRHAISNGSDLTYLQEQFRQPSAFSNHFSSIISMTVETMYNFLDPTTDDTIFKKTVWKSMWQAVNGPTELHPKSRHNQTYECSRCSLLMPGLGFTNSQLKMENPWCAACQWITQEEAWLWHSKESQMGIRTSAAYSMLGENTKDLRDLVNRLFPLSSENEDPGSTVISLPNPGNEDRITASTSLPNLPSQTTSINPSPNPGNEDQITTTTSLVGSQRAVPAQSQQLAPPPLQHPQLTAEEQRIVRMPAHLFQEFATVCPRSLMGSLCSLGSACSLLKAYVSTSLHSGPF